MFIAYIISSEVAGYQSENQYIQFTQRTAFCYPPSTSNAKIRNVETNQCLDNMARKENEKVGIFNCHGMGGNQVFSYTANKEIRTDDLCLDVSKLNGPVTMLKCHHLKGNQLWEYDPVKLTLLHVNSNQCLDKATEEDSQVPSIKDCSGSRSQQWLLRNVTLPEIF
ncbi:hypothetical protein JD844_002481 [Phrynosoma platyrhinos]|uniref:Ricin B lectin domain-containing protein n=1 Tax=Phrynosoma platyrhinos TaxID=52577 RepID=A0ABQ7TBJ7_PHRPL|nr:hypothetical protein JD844_002481 [Phrynosoma platyrhinos]